MRLKLIIDWREHIQVLGCTWRDLADLDIEGRPNWVEWNDECNVAYDFNTGTGYYHTLGGYWHEEVITFEEFMKDPTRDFRVSYYPAADMPLAEALTKAVEYGRESLFWKGVYLPVRQR